MHDTDWMADAACADMDTNLFFPEIGESTAAARAVCVRCPVAERCLQQAMAIEPVPDGVWGGTTRAQRTALRSGKPISLAGPGRGAAKLRHSTWADAYRAAREEAS